MRRSAQVIAPLLAASAVALLSGCQRAGMRRCVDAQDVVVAYELCSANGEQRILGRRPSPAGTFHYYYGGEGTHEAGTVATGGSRFPQAGQTYETPTRATRRKGFGGALPALLLTGVVGAAVIFGAGE